MQKNALVSAIVSTYNSEKYIQGKIEDLLSQSIADQLEIIIINSGSKQNEESIIAPYLKKYPQIKYVKTEERETVYKAWNRGIRASSGKFITNANTDDRLRKDAYEILSDYLNRNPDVALVYADQILTTRENQTYIEARGNIKIRFPEYSHLRQLERCIVGSQPMWRSAIHTEDNIWFDEKYEVCGDHDFELRISEKYVIKHVNQDLGTFYKSPAKTNKELQDPSLTNREVVRLTTEYLDRYVGNLGKDELERIKKEYRLNIISPVIFYEIVKRTEKVFFPVIYPRYFFHSIEFIYYLNILIYEKEKNFEVCRNLCKKFLKYKKSDRISEKLKQYDALLT